MRDEDQQDGTDGDRLLIEHPVDRLDGLQAALRSAAQWGKDLPDGNMEGRQDTRRIGDRTAEYTALSKEHLPV